MVQRISIVTTTEWLRIPAFHLHSYRIEEEHNSINFHIIRESAAAGIIRVGKEDTETNIAGAATKILSFLRSEKLLGPHLYIDVSLLWIAYWIYRFAGTNHSARGFTS